jgi:3-hydroxybutyryl-CoA dehydrogenase
MEQALRIGVCGAGTMGAGIAQVLAAHGYSVFLYDVQTAMLEKAQLQIQKGLQKVGEKKLWTAQQIATANNLVEYQADINYCQADIIIEAIVEKPEIKLGLYGQLHEVNHSDTIIVSNTSSLSINYLQEKIPNPARFAGLHFFNPAPLMPLVEIVQGKLTSQETINTLTALVNACQKTPVLCIDSPGFIVNRVARPFYIEALRLAEQGADYKTIDTALTQAGFKLGPFALMDMIGNDINYAVSNQVYNQLQQPERLKPSYLQEQLVNENNLGKKTGKGYYNYE